MIVLFLEMHSQQQGFLLVLLLMMLNLHLCSSEVQTVSKDQLRHMEGTVILHITFAAKQDQDLGKEFIKYLKVQCIQELW